MAGCKVFSFTVNASLTVSRDIEEAQALRLFEKAERSCLITNFLAAAMRLNATRVRGKLGNKETPYRRRGEPS
jgi:uncharacterized OsmC-like protein